jgi:hypothetical protein
MEVQAKLQIGNNDAKLYQKNYNVVTLFCRFARHASVNRPDTDARCECIDITLLAPTMEDNSLYDWYVNGESLSGRVSFDLTNGLGNSNSDDGDLVFEDAYCFAIEENYDIDKPTRRTIKLSLIAEKMTFEGATFENPYDNQ